MFNQRCNFIYYSSYERYTCGLYTFFCAFLALAQFTIEGKISGYADRSVVLKKNDGYKTQTLIEFITNSQGSFAQKILIPYEGTLLMEFDDEQFFSIIF